MNGPKLIGGKWRVRILGLGVFRYKLATSKSFNPNTDTMPILQSLERGTPFDGWQYEERENVLRAILQAHRMLA